MNWFVSDFISGQDDTLGMPPTPLESAQFRRFSGSSEINDYLHGASEAAGGEALLVLVRQLLQPRMLPLLIARVPLLTSARTVTRRCRA